MTVPVSISFQLRPTFQSEMDAYTADRERSRQGRETITVAIYAVMCGLVLTVGFVALLIFKGIGRLLNHFAD